MVWYRNYYKLIFLIIFDGYTFCLPIFTFLQNATELSPHAAQVRVSLSPVFGLRVTAAAGRARMPESSMGRKCGRESNKDVTSQRVTGRFGYELTRTVSCWGLLACCSDPSHCHWFQCQHNACNVLVAQAHFWRPYGVCSRAVTTARGTGSRWTCSHPGKEWGAAEPQRGLDTPRLFQGWKSQRYTSDQRYVKVVKRKPKPTYIEGCGQADTKWSGLAWLWSGLDRVLIVWRLLVVFE